MWDSAACIATMTSSRTCQPLMPDDCTVSGEPTSTFSTFSCTDTLALKKTGKGTQRTPLWTFPRDRHKHLWPQGRIMRVWTGEQHPLPLTQASVYRPSITLPVVNTHTQLKARPWPRLRNCYGRWMNGWIDGLMNGWIDGLHWAADFDAEAVQYNHRLLCFTEPN